VQKGAAAWSIASVEPGNSYLGQRPSWFDVQTRNGASSERDDGVGLPRLSTVGAKGQSGGGVDFGGKPPGAPGARPALAMQERPEHWFSVTAQRANAGPFQWLEREDSRVHDLALIANGRHFFYHQVERHHMTLFDEFVGAPGVLLAREWTCEKDSL
jgi:hypothetical protein